MWLFSMSEDWRLSETSSNCIHLAVVQPFASFATSEFPAASSTIALVPAMESRAVKCNV